jgi:DNA-binding SARP family transcriptional activator
MLWFRLDAADGSIDTFLYFLGTAARHRTGDGAPVSPGFASAATDENSLRRSLERAFAALPRGFALVLDEYQSIEAGAGLHRVLPVLVEALPEGATLFVISRDVPPATLARIAAGPGFIRFDGEALRLTPDESAALAASLGVRETEAQGRLARASGGWAAGIVLLARAMLAGVPLPHAGNGLPREMLDYFSVEVFEQLPPAVRGFLLRTAAMPWTTPDIATALTGHAESERVLDELHRSNLFIERKRSDTALYVYHPLFRRFLAARARESLDAAELHEIHRLAARKLVESGEPEAAVPLLADVRAWGEIASLVREQAPRLTGLGRISTVRAWIELVPETARAQRPWTLFWLAWCKLAAREAGAREGFERAYVQFSRAGDVEGQFVSCAWLLRFAGSRETADRWIGELEQLAARHPMFDDPALEASILSSFSAVQQFRPRHPLIEHWHARATTLARTASTPGVRLKLASFALGNHLAYGEVDAMGALVVEHRDAVDDPGVEPGDALRFLVFEGYHQLFTGADTAAAATLDRLEALAAETGCLPDHDVVARFGLHLAIARGDVAAARRHRSTVARLSAPWPDCAHHRVIGDACLALIEGDAEAAFVAARAAGAPETTCPILEPERAACLATAMLARGESTEIVLGEVLPALESARHQRMPSAQLSLLLLAALARLRAGEIQRALENLGEGLRFGARMGSLPRIPFVPHDMLAELASLALAHDVEARYAERLVVRLGLVPSANAPARWPWPIRVRTLGGFSVESRRARDTNAGRNARKPHELLKYIVAAGVRDVAAGRAIATLWPDLDGDAGKKAFDITLHRLRKSLGADAAVRLESGKLSVDPQLVWVDASAFERLATEAESRVASGDPLSDRALDDSLALYVGHFLVTDDDLPWVVPHRARLRDRFIRLADLASARWEASGDWHRAERVCRNALALEPTAESIHQRLIRVLAESGRPAEALEAYRRCRELLSIVLGARPSPRTEALRDRIRGTAAVREPVYGK